MRYLIFGTLAILTCSCFVQEATPADFVLETLRTEVADARQAQHFTEAELGILESRLESQEKSLAKVMGNVHNQVDSQISSMEQELQQMAERQKRVLADIRQLSRDASANRIQMANTKEELDHLHDQLAQNVHQLKDALESVVAVAVQKGSATYKVKSGDTLDQIAKVNRTTVEKLKSANGLKGDTIYPNQELIIP